ncbi:MAG: ATP-binding protein [bacterium]|nr:ATP-binding protein [bacterium]
MPFPRIHEPFIGAAYLALLLALFYLLWHVNAIKEVSGVAVAVIGIGITLFLGLLHVLGIREARMMESWQTEQTEAERARMSALAFSGGLMRAILEHSNFAYALFDLKGRLIAWNGLANQHAVDLTGRGLEPGEVSGERLGEPYYKRFWAIFAQVQLGESIQETWTFADMNNGKTRHFTVRYNPVYDDYGVLIGICSVSEDITQRVEFEREMRENDQVIREIAEHARVSFWVRDLHTRRYVYVNPVYDEMFQLPGRELFIDPDAYLKRLHPEDVAVNQEAIRRYLAGEAPYNTRYRIILNDGSIRWIWARTYLIHNSDGVPYRSVGIAEDITAFKDAEDRAVLLELERRRRDLLTTFIHSISHEFRTPLATIHSGLYLLRRTADPAAREARIERIEDQANTILRLVEDMTTMTRLEHDPQFTLQPIDLHALLNEITASYNAEASEKGLMIVYDADLDLPPVPVSSQEFTHAVRRLIANALQYTPQGGTIHVTLMRSAADVRLQVRDTGVGMTKAELERAFEIFYRVDDAHSTAGLGLGLPVARRVIERHNGTLTAESEPGKGSVFTITLPFPAQHAIAR